MTDVRSSGVNTIIEVVPDVQLTLYIRMGERISAGGPQVRLNEVELAASTITGNGYDCCSLQRTPASLKCEHI